MYNHLKTNILAIFQIPITVGQVFDLHFPKKNNAEPSPTQRAKSVLFWYMGRQASYFAVKISSFKYLLITKLLKFMM
jgi:hypothetical protein